MSDWQRISAMARELELVALGECDAAAVETLRQIRNLPEIRTNMYTDHEIDRDEHAAWTAKRVTDRHSRFFAVRWQHRIVGAVSLSNLDSPGGRAEWAFYLHPDTRGKNLGSALEWKLLDMAFISVGNGSGGLGLRKLDCEVLAFNAPVIALHRRFGFAIEGRRRQRIRRDGAAIDAVLLGITADEWTQNRKRLLAGEENTQMTRTSDDYLAIIDEIEKIRGKNNKNWMDLLRLAFKHAPKEAGDIVAEIYRSDSDISALTKKLTQ